MITNSSQNDWWELYKGATNLKKDTTKQIRLAPQIARQLTRNPTITVGKHRRKSNSSIISRRNNSIHGSIFSTEDDESIPAVPAIPDFVHMKKIIASDESLPKLDKKMVDANKSLGDMTKIPPVPSLNRPSVQSSMSKDSIMQEAINIPFQKLILSDEQLEISLYNSEEKQLKVYASNSLGNLTKAPPKQTIEFSFISKKFQECLSKNLPTKLSVYRMTLLKFVGEVYDSETLFSDNMQQLVKV